jgi:hypothetical protein
MTPYERRDAQTAEAIRREIEKVKTNAQRCGWKPTQEAWHRAFGEISGLHRALQLIDPNANDVLPPLPLSFTSVLKP